MNRRDALKNIGFAAGFAIATPTIFSLLQSCTAEAKTWTPIFVTEEQKIVLTRITDIILPKTEALPSASEINIPQFLDKFMAEVLDAEEKAKTTETFNRIIGLLKPNTETIITDLTDEDYKALLDKYMRIKDEIDEDREVDPTAEIITNSEFLNQVKWLTINAYKNSEEIGENVLIYDPIPGAYYCGDLQELTGGKSYSL